MTKKDAMKEISELVEAAKEQILQAEKLANKNGIPFDFQFAYSGIDKVKKEEDGYTDSDSYDSEYNSIYPDKIITSHDWRYERWNNSSIGC